MKKLHAAIIGTGSIASSHLKALQSFPDRVECVAAVDVEEERVTAFAAGFGIPQTYTNADVMLQREKPDLVHIATPPGTHVELTLKALAAGAWVLCEKPVCGSLAEFDAISAAEEKSGAFASGVFQWRFGSGVQHLKKLIENKSLGRFLVGLCQTTWYRDSDYYSVPWRGKWETELGGPTMIHGIHQMDVVFYLLGEWREVRAMAGTLDRDLEVEDVSMAVVQLENEAMVSVINSVVSPREETRLRFDFQRVTVEVNAESVYSYTNADWDFSLPLGSTDQDELKRWRDITGDVPATHTAQLAALLDSFERGERPLVSGQESRRVIEFITALYKSAATGQPVSRGSITSPDAYYYHVAGQNLKRRGA